MSDYKPSPFYATTSEPVEPISPVVDEPSLEPAVDQSTLDSWWYDLSQLQFTLENSGFDGLAEELSRVVREIHSYLR